MGNQDPLNGLTHPNAIWETAAHTFHWDQPWDRLVEGDFSSANVKWFTQGKLNITKNCLDRHLEDRGNKLALIWEPNDPREKFIRYTFKELYVQVCRFAAVLSRNDIRKGDRVCIFMPMIPETIMAMLACARIGAVHVVIFSDFSAHAIAERIRDCQAKVVITSDGLNHGAKQIPLKRIMDEALTSVESVNKVIVVERLGWAVGMEQDRDVWFEDEIQEIESHPDPEIMDAEDPLFILYTSGSSGKPAGVVHTCGGYMVQCGYVFRTLFDIQESDIFYCTADVAWITGHSMLVYGPLLNGTTLVMYEGAPNYPDTTRMCEIIDKHNVTVFYTSPSVIRIMKASYLEDIVDYSLNSLRLLGIVGEPIDRQTWNWFYIHIGKEKCPVINTWIQTETGTVLIGSDPEQEDWPEYTGKSFPGIDLLVVDPEGNEIALPDQEGRLFITEPWPSVARNIWNNPESYRENYFAKKEGYYFTGDGALIDRTGQIKITGRVDDVINIHGQRYAVLEIENAINRHPMVLESAVVMYSNLIDVPGLYAFVVWSDTVNSPDRMKEEIKEQVNALIGKSAIPSIIQLVRELPKTASGKVVRSILSGIVNGDFEMKPDKSIMRNPHILPDIVQGARKLLTVE